MPLNAILLKNKKFCLNFQKLQNMKMMIILIVIGALGTVTRTGGLGNKRRSGDHYF